MRKVLRNMRETAHYWANELQDEGRSGHVYFEDGIIYSYGTHFPIAKHVVNDAGQKAVLFTTRNYSSDTGKHKNAVRMAANHLDIIYCDNPGCSHEHNFEQWLRDVEVVAAKLVVARKPEMYLSRISDIQNDVNKYALFFGLAFPLTLSKALEISDKGEYFNYTKNRVEYERTQRLLAEKALKAKLKVDLEKWMKFETHSVSSRLDRDYLRFNSKKNRVETTQSIEIPAEIGRRFFEKIKDGSISVGDYILNYRVREIGKDIKIGCHTFPVNYLLEFGAKYL